MKKGGPTGVVPLALQYLNIPVIIAYKDPNPENGLLPLEAPLTSPSVSALRAEFLVQDGCSANVWLNSGMLVFVRSLLDSQPPRGGEGRANKFSVWRAVRILESGLHPCAACPPLKSFVLKRHQ